MNGGASGFAGRGFTGDTAVRARARYFSVHPERPPAWFMPLGGLARRQRKPESAHEKYPPVPQCLENPTSAAVPALPVVPEPGCADGVGAAVAAKKGRVLLLDDDPAFRDIIHDFLSEEGYTVTAVKSGVEGIREVLAGDFTVILCDLMMPGLSGDMFYRAVEQSRPHLCERFVFMSGHRGETRANGFIKSVHGYILQKPFQLQGLADSIALAEVRATYKSVFAFDAIAPVDAPFQAPAAPDWLEIPPGGSPAVPLAKSRRLSPKKRLRRREGGNDDPAPARHEEQRPPPGLAGESQKSVAGLARKPGSGIENATGQGLSDQLERDRRSKRALLTLLAVLALVAGPLGTWYVKLAQRDVVLSVEASRLHGEWANVSAALSDASSMRRVHQATVQQVVRIEQEREEPSWVPVIRSVVTCAGPGILLREVRGREISGDARAWKLQVGGISTGVAPRRGADYFREALQGHLERAFPGRVSTKFEQLDDLPAAALARPDERRGSFTVSATIDFAGRTPAEVK